MPVRSLNSAVMKWPDARTVTEAAKRWAMETGPLHPHVLRIGYFGSLATGRWGVGSDLDLFVELEKSDVPFERRGAGFDLSGIPVSVDLLAYTRAEIERMRSRGSPFLDMISKTAVWIYRR